MGDVDENIFLGEEVKLGTVPQPLAGILEGFLYTSIVIYTRIQILNL